MRRLSRKKNKSKCCKRKRIRAFKSNIIRRQRKIEDKADEFINEELEVNSTKEAITGAMDIVAEIIADDFELKNSLENCFLIQQ